VIPREVFTADGSVTLNADRDATEIDVENTGDRPIQVSSHFHFYEVNAALSFDRQQSYARRLDIPSGTAGALRARRAQASWC
jgi:urease subunit beta